MRYSVNFYHYDGLGSVIALSNVNGEIVERYSYDVFGEATIRDTLHEIRDTSAFANPYMICSPAAKILVQSWNQANR